MRIEKSKKEGISMKWKVKRNPNYDPSTKAPTLKNIYRDMSYIHYEWEKDPAVSRERHMPPK